MTEPVPAPAPPPLPTAPLEPVVAAPSGPPRVWPLAVAFVSLLVGLVAVSGALGGLMLALEARGGSSPPKNPEELALFVHALTTSPVFFSLASLGNNVAELLLALVPAALSAVAWRERLRLVPAERLTRWGWVLGAVGVVAVGQAMSSLAEVVRLSPGGSMELLGELAETSTPEAFALLLLVGSVGAGVGEEVFFRGYLQTRLVERWGRWPGIVLTALAFGVFHLDPMHGVFAFGIGLYLGWLAERSRSIYPSIAAHAFNNLVAFCAARWAPDGGEQDFGQLTLLVALGVAWACVAWLRRTREREPTAPASVPPTETPREPGPAELEVALVELGAEPVTGEAGRVAGGLLALQGALLVVQPVLEGFMPFAHAPAPWTGMALLTLGLACVLGALGTLRGLVQLWAGAGALLVVAAVGGAGGGAGTALVAALPWLAVLYLAGEERPRPALLAAALVGVAAMLWNTGLRPR